MKTTAKVSLDQKTKTVTIDKLSTSSPLVFELFDGRKKADYVNTLEQVLHIGALALIEDRIHALIDKTGRDIFPELERFKLMFQRHKLEFDKTTQKGEEAEVDVVRVLNDFIQERGWTDLAQASGTTKGTLARNKTGDVLCVLEFSEEKSGGQITLGIEVKLDKSVQFGDPETEKVFKGETQSGSVKKSNFDTAWTQLLETRANRECPFSIMVFDRNKLHSSVAKVVSDIAYLPGVPGFVVIVDTMKGDFRNLLVAYQIARDLARYHLRDDGDIDPQILDLLVKRIIHFMGSARTVADLVKKHRDNTIKMANEVNLEVSRFLHLAEFTHDYLKRFLSDRTLSAKDMLEFYYATEAKANWSADKIDLETELKSILND
ncbi:MAG: hypothetical protein VX589_11775 [Myxococcota bacterium]|nr:hypothetical protein [Myxococcota bacterium]